MLPENESPPPVSVTSSKNTWVRDPTIYFFGMFVILHVVGWTIVPALAQRSLPFDTIEMLYWGHEWQWGYYKHPPLPAWIAEGCWLLFGGADWPLYFCSQICVALCFIAAWRFAREVLSPWPALVSVMLLELCPYLNFTTPQWNNNGPTKPAWAFAILFVYLALTRRRPWFWVGAGVSLGLAMLAKYDVLLLIVSLTGFLAIHPTARWVWRTPGPYAMFCVAGCIVAPHLAWLPSADNPTLSYLSSRLPEQDSWTDHILHPLEFLASQTGAVIGIPLLISSVFGWKWHRKPAEDSRAVARDYLLCVVFGPPLLAISVSIFTGLYLVALWGSAMWTFFGVLLMVLFEPAGTVGQYRQLARRCIAWGAIFLAAFGIAKAFHGELKGVPRRVQYPGRALANEVERRWSLAVNDQPLQLIGGDWWLAGLASFYDPQRPHVYPELQPSWAPWTDDQMMKQHGGVLLWLGPKPQFADWENIEKRFPQVRKEPPMILPVPGVFRDLSVCIHMAIIPPSGS